jgi:anti-sigma-K factor RskA
MKNHELIEMSLLDAYGLLDDHEREAFERSFAASSPAVQAQVRREQTRFASMDMLLPDAEAPADLRARVLERVRRAIAAQDEGAVRHASGAVPTIARSRRVSPVWRAGALACAAAAVVFGVTTLQMRAQYDKLESDIQDDQLLAQMLQGSDRSDLRDLLFNARTERVVFTPANPAVPGEASLWINPDWQNGRLFYLNLPRVQGNAYKLAVVDEAGNVVDVVAEFDSSGGLMTRSVPSTAGAGTLAILGPGANGKQTPLMVAKAKPKA